jgi:hypothetical protein
VAVAVAVARPDLLKTLAVPDSLAKSRLRIATKVA